MLEKEILQLLHKISRQLEDISMVQDEIREEMSALYRHIMELQETTIRNLENLLPSDQRPNILLN